MRRCPKALKSRRGRTRSDFFTAVARFSFRTSPREEPATPPLSHPHTPTQGIWRDSFTFRPPQRQPEQVDGGILGGELSTGLDDLAELTVDGLDRIRRVHDLADVRREREERDEPVPHPPP